MKTTDFKPFFSLCKRIYSKSTLPILEYVYIKDGVAMFSNLEVTISKSFEELKDSGEFFLPLSKTLGVFDIKDEEVHFSIEDKIVKIKLGKKEVSFSNKDCYDREGKHDYPILQEVDFSPCLLLTLDMVEKVKSAVKYVSKDGLRPERETVFVGEDHIVGTDAYILFFKKKDHGEKTVMIPSSVVPLLIGEQYYVSENDKYIKMVGEDGVTIVYRKVDGVFPQYRSVIPTQFNAEIKFDTKELIENYPIVKSLFKDIIKSCAFLFDFSGSEVLVSIKNIDDGSNLDFKFPMARISGEFGKIRLGVEKLMGIINNEKYKTISLKLIDSSRCVIINDEILLMPCLLNE